MNISTFNIPGDLSSHNDDSWTNGDSDEDMDWEEVVLPPAATPGLEDLSIDLYMEGTSDTHSQEPKPKNIEITLARGKKDPAVKKKGPSNAERVTRLNCHKTHTIALIANALTRNKWINDPLLRARLMSLTPLPLQNSFLMITKKRQENAAKRGRLFEAAVLRLTQWWYESFDVTDSGHIRSRTFDQVQKAVANDEVDEEDSEVIRSSNSLMKHALMQRGCRDTSAQLFTALCRALGIPARLVVSLQSVPWQAKVGKPKPKPRLKSKKGKEKAEDASEVESERRGEDDDDNDDDMEEVDIEGATASVTSKKKEKAFPGSGQTLSGTVGKVDKGKGKAVPKPIIRLRKSRPAGQRLGSGSSTPSRQRSPGPPIGGYPPVFWAEVFSRPDGRWMPVDPVRYIVNKRKVFEPPAHDKNNRMVYVVAIEEDGYARDVTPRYAREYSAKTAKVQLGGKGRKEWWEQVMGLVTRPFRLNRDDMEDEEFEFNQIMEGMPVSVIGFKDHPLYVLERHLKRDEVIFPKTELGKFRGEPVYPRQNVISLKTAENWMRMGRKIKECCQAMKWVKQRAVTIHRRRVVEMAQQGGEEVTQGLYSEAQTELYRPEPIVDGRIPRNDFGNIDLYVPTMLPPGAAHVPYKGTVKIARDLGFSYAEAVTSFEFKKGRAFPVITGIVIAAENEEALLEAYWESEQNAEEKERAKREERVLKRWTRLVQGLRIRQRLQEDYADREPPSINQEQQEQGEIGTHQPGGFLTQADEVVQPFHLPKFQHGTYQPFHGPGTAPEVAELKEKGIIAEPPMSEPLTMETVGDDDDDDDRLKEAEAIDLVDLRRSGAPKTMRELAEAAAQNENEKRETEPANGIGRAPSHTLAEENGRVAKARRREGGAASSRVDTPATSTSTRANRRAKKRGRGSSLSTSSSSAEDEKPSPSKRSKAISVPPATRVLRTRVPKSAEELREEREKEKALRRAMAE